MRAGFEYYRALPVDSERNKELPMNKITTPVLVLVADFYAALGDPGNLVLSTTQPLAADVRGVIVPLSGHWIAEEQPQFVIDLLSKLFG